MSVPEHPGDPGLASRPPGVTTVIPTHRRPERMREAVSSVVQQSYAGDIEIIVVFDACDVSLPDVDLPASRELRGVANDRVRGLAGARNSGILAAKHDFVAFLDDDDVWLPGKLEAQMPLFEHHPEAGLVGTAMRVDDGRSTHDRLAPDTVEHVAPVRLVNRPLIVVRWSGESYFYGHWGPYAEGHTYLLDKHPDLRADDYAYSRISSQIGFALAADGRGRPARTWLRRSLRLQPLNVRAWLGVLISYRLLSARLVARVANLVGKGI
jgi:glycosyltransferase involved in cell wall biosynthesis